MGILYTTPSLQSTLHECSIFYYSFIYLFVYLFFCQIYQLKKNVAMQTEYNVKQENLMQWSRTFDPFNISWKNEKLIN